MIGNMKFRKNSTHEFCVTNALGLGAYCLHKVPLFVFVRFLSENFSIAVHSQPFEFFSVSAVHSEPFKIIF